MGSCRMHCFVPASFTYHFARCLFLWHPWTFLLLHSILSHDYSKIYVSIFSLQTINKITFELLCMRASCFSLCNPMDCSQPGSSVHGILQARVLEWVTIPISRGYSWPRDWTQVSCLVGRFFTIWATREAWTVRNK